MRRIWFCPYGQKLILNNRKKQERISGLWIVALPRPGGWKDIEDVRFWHGEGCGRGTSFFVGNKNGLCSKRREMRGKYV